MGELDDEVADFRQRRLVELPRHQREKVAERARGSHVVPGP